MCPAPCCRRCRPRGAPSALLFWRCSSYGGPTTRKCSASVVLGCAVALSANMELEGRWRDLDYLLTRQGNVVGPGFEPGPEIREFLESDCR